jgi:hypothetical protein
VLDLSKIEAGKLELNPQTVQLAPLIEEVIGTARQLAEQNKNRLLVEAQENLGSLTVDSMRLRQILLNLLSNAFKFTKEGEVTLRARRALAPIQMKIVAQLLRSHALFHQRHRGLPAARNAAGRRRRGQVFGQPSDARRRELSRPCRGAAASGGTGRLPIPTQNLSARVTCAGSCLIVSVPGAPPDLSGRSGENRPNDRFGQRDWLGVRLRYSGSKTGSNIVRTLV